jgi:hypothetical protein
MIKPSKEQWLINVLWLMAALSAVQVVWRRWTS